MVGDDDPQGWEGLLAENEIRIAASRWAQKQVPLVSGSATIAYGLVLGVYVYGKLGQ